MPTTTIHDILAAYRATSQTEREKGTYFEELIRTYQLRRRKTYPAGHIGAMCVDSRRATP